MPCPAVICTNVDPDNLPPTTAKRVALYLYGFAVEFGIIGVGSIDFFDGRNGTLHGHLLNRWCAFPIPPILTHIRPKTLVIPLLPLAAALFVTQHNALQPLDAPCSHVARDKRPQREPMISRQRLSTHLVHKQNIATFRDSLLDRDTCAVCLCAHELRMLDLVLGIVVDWEACVSEHIAQATASEG